MLGVEKEYVVSDYFVNQILPQFWCDLERIDSQR